jgi:hypothetical protein
MNLGITMIVFSAKQFKRAVDFVDGRFSTRVGLSMTIPSFRVMKIALGEGGGSF